MSIFSDISTQSERDLVSDWGEGNASDSDILARFRELALPLAVAACAVSGFGLATAFAQKNHQPHDAKLFGGAAGIIALAASPFARKIGVISPAWHAVQIHNRLEDVTWSRRNIDHQLETAHRKVKIEQFPILLAQKNQTERLLEDVTREYISRIRKLGVESVPPAYRQRYTEITHTL